MRVLVIEDDAAIMGVLRRGLVREGFLLDCAEDGLRGIVLAREARYDLIILDVMLPTRDGWQVCAELRDSGDRTPILMLTARDGVADRIRGLEIGADDYLPKPFEFPELLARVRAQTRRGQVHRSRVIRIWDLTIDTARRTVERAGREIGLSQREYELLEALAGREGQVLTREMIQERVWMDTDSVSNIVDVYIRTLRKKIDDAHAVKLIHTLRGVGYTLRAPQPSRA